MRRLNLLSALCAMLFLSSCWDIDDYKNIDIEPFNPSFGYPILSSKITINEMVDANASDDSNLFFEIRNDSVFLRFKKEFSYQANIVIPDNEFEQSIPVIPFTPNLYFDHYITIDNTSAIKLIDLKAGELWIELEKNFPQNVEVELLLSSLIINGNERYKVSADWSSNQYLSRHTYNISDATLELFRKVDEDTVYNSLSYSVQLGESAGVGILTVRMGLRSVEYKRIVGKIDFSEAINETEIEIPFFSSVNAGQLFLKDPRFVFNIGTSIGTPISLLFDEVKFTNSMGNELLLQNEGVTQAGDFLFGTKNYLPLLASNTNPYVNSKYKITGTNSNIEQVLPLSPNMISISGEFQLGDTEESYPYLHNFFIRDTSTLKVNLDLEAPLIGSIEDLRFNFSFEEISWEDLTKEEMLKDYSASIFIKTVNGIPLTFDMQVYFIDENGVAIDSLFTANSPESIIQSPQIVNEVPNPLKPTKEKLTVIQIPKSKYDKIAKTNEIELVLVVNTGDGIQRNVKIKPNHSLEIQLSVAISAKVKPTF
jgi:hypothetical protein